MPSMQRGRCSAYINKIFIYEEGEGIISERINNSTNAAESRFFGKYLF
jgi:hypothetical protein